MPQLDEVPVIGPIGPRRDSVDAPYWEGLAEGELRLQRCADCNHWWWSPVWRCGKCGSWELGWECIEPKGRVFSWVRAEQAFSPVMASVVPFVTLLVELPHAGNRRLFGVLVGPEDRLEIGANVEGVIQQPSPITQGKPVLRWKLSS
jgi:uncharacterized OB-fold protein